MKLINLITLLIFFTIFSVKSFSDESTDCSKIKKDTLVGSWKTYLCKKGSDKLDKDGNFKKGAFKFFKIPGTKKN